MTNWSYAALAQNLLNLVNMINASNLPIMNEDKLDFKIMKNITKTKFMESILKHGDGNFHNWKIVDKKVFGVILFFCFSMRNHYQG
jgi:hypothetical protein